MTVSGTYWQEGGERRAESVVADEKLIETARGGDRVALGDDRAAFGALVEAHQDRLFRSACSLTRSATDAEDLVQETFVRAWGALGRFRGDCAFSTWLFAILLNVYRRWLRTQRRRRRVHVDATDTELADPAPSHGRRIAGADELDRALRAIDRLPPRLREVMVLRHVEEMSYDEIARAADCRIGTVRSRLHRARQLLVTRLGRNERRQGQRHTAPIKKRAREQ